MFALNCTPCAARGTCRLGLHDEEFSDAGHALTASAICSAQDEGMAGFAHGGWTASVLDEVLGHVAIHHRGFAVTSRLDVRYLRPVPVGRPIVARASLVSSDLQRIEVSGCLELHGHALATASGVWVPVDKSSHSRRFDRWAAAGEVRPAPTSHE